MSERQVWAICNPAEPNYASLDNWMQSGKDLVAGQGAAHQFAIADWLLYGDERWGEMAYDKAEEVTGFARQTLYDYVSTARSFPPETRKYPSASFNHYRAVASVGDLEKRDFLMLQAGACTVRELRDKVNPRLSKQDKFTRQVKGDASITVIVSGYERTVLKDLASLRGVDISVIVRPLIAEYIERTGRSEWSNGWPRLKELKKNRLNARREDWIKQTSESIEGLIKEYQERNGPLPDPRDFVKGWELRTGRKFTPRVFNFAIKNTELAHCCGTRNREAYGFPPISPRKKSKEGYRPHWKRATSKELIGLAASAVTDILTPRLNGTWQGINDVSSVVKAELISRRLGHTRYFDEGFRRALKSLQKEGKVQIEEKRIRKTEAA
jgi:hypothetical protein